MNELDVRSEPPSEAEYGRLLGPWARTLVVALIIILAWSASLRFMGITRSRLLLCDESFYQLEARRIVGQVRACWRIYEIYRRDRPTGLIHLSQGDRAEIEGLASEGYGQLGGRFGHDVFLAAAIVLGLPQEWSGQLIAAMFGLATVALVAIWSARIRGPRAAIFSAAFLGGSVVHLTYSRSALCESDSVFFIIAALLAYSSSFGAVTPGRRHAWSLLAGVIFGCAFVCNIRAIPIAYGLIVFEALRLTPRDSALRLLLFGAGAALPLVVAESIYHVIFLFAGATGVQLTRQTYLMTILWQIFRLKGGLIAAGANLGHYPRYLATVENPLLLVVGALGLAFVSWRAFRKRGLDERLIAVVVVVNALYWQFGVGIKCLRYLAPLVPLIAIAAGIGLASLHDSIASRAPRQSSCLMWAALLVLVGSSSMTWSRWQGETPGYREAAAWLAEQKSPRLVATQANYFRLVFPMRDVEVATNLDDLKRAHAKGYRWYVDCFQKYHWPFSGDLIVIQKALRDKAQPRVFDQPLGASAFTWFEAGMAQVPPDWNADAGTIKIWDLDEVFNSTP